MVRTAEEQQNLQLIRDYFDALETGDEDFITNFTNENFTEDVVFNIVVQRSDYDDASHTHESFAINPAIFPFRGPEGALTFTGGLAVFRQVPRFNIDKYIVDGNKIALFGDYVHFANTTENFAITPLALQVEIEDGKISRYHIREDSWASISAEREGGSWQGQFGGGENPLFNNVIFGSRSGDNLVGSNGSDLIYGYQENDSIAGGAGKDEIWPGSGLDIVSGGQGSDTFVLVWGEGTNTITDFEDGIDTIGLARKTDHIFDQEAFSVTVETTDLNFADLIVGASGSDATVTIAATGEVLAVINGAAGLIDEADFIKMPTGEVLEGFSAEADINQAPPEADEARNIAVAEGYFDSFQTGTVPEYVSANFTADSRYVVVRADNDYSETSLFHERNRILPWTETHVGPSEIVDFVGELTAQFNILEFNVETVFAEGNTVAVFGNFLFEHTRTGNLVSEAPFAVNIEFDEEGKISFYHFFEDTYAIATGLRDEGTWNRFDREIVFGSNAADNLTGTDGGDLIYSYQSNDAIDGGAGGDELWAGSGNDMVMGGEGDDSLYGNEESDVLNGGNGNDFINGNQNEDLIDGGLGNDTLRGGKDNDNITGGGGDDWIWGDLGSDILTGSGGSDRFVFGPGTGSDIIADFEEGSDLIALTDGLTAGSLAIADNGAGGTTISANGELLVTINNVSASVIAGAIDDVTLA